jgi:hypothetical protein
MTAAERDALVRDLERIGVYVQEVQPRPWHEGEWQLYCWCPDPPHFYWITDAARFRQAVRAALSDVLPRGALD